MKVSLRWLKKYVPIETKDDNIKKLIDRLTMLGLEVDSVFDRFDYLNKILIGKIEKIKNIKKYFLHIINCGKNIIEVVSAIKNLSVGMLVPVAMAGTDLPRGIVRKKKINGYYSSGIFCSEYDLQIGKNLSNIIILDEGYLPGSNLKDFLRISDLVIDISLTPNRPDCASFLGIAREISSITKSNIYYKKTKFVKTNSKKINNFVSINILEKKKCIKYSIRMFDNIKIKESPFWLQNYLISIGISPVNNIVDITNFVMFETGQPLHAYDFDSVKKGKIRIESSKESENIITLDNKIRKIPKKSLVIYNEKTPISIAGIIGCNISKITSKTKKVLIESAYFEASSIRKIAKKLGINTDSSYRFERGIDTNCVKKALDRATSIIKILINNVYDYGSIHYDFMTNLNNNNIKLDINDVTSTLGIDLSISKIKEILSSVGFLVKEYNNIILKVKVPTYRVDVKISEDLIEEIARIYGYDMIPIKYPKIQTINEQNSEKNDEIILFKSILKSIGFSEIITYSFIDKIFLEYIDSEANNNKTNRLEILNPISSKHSIMRTSIIPGILDVISKNNLKKINNLKLFELGKVFFSNGLNKLPKELDFIVAVLSGKIGNSYWKELKRECDFFDIKGYLENFLENLHIFDFEFNKTNNNKFNYMKKGYSAEINCCGIAIGFIWEFNNNILKKFSIKEPVFGFEINIEALKKCLPKYKKVKSIAKFPSVSRDTTLIVDKKINIGLLFKELNNINEDFLESFSLLDVFYNQSSKKQKKNVTFKIIYRSKNKTLNDKTINLVHKRVIEKLVYKFKAELP